MKILNSKDKENSVNENKVKQDSIPGMIQQNNMIVNGNINNINTVNNEIIIINNINLGKQTKTPNRHNSVKEAITTKLPFMLVEKVKIPKFIISDVNTEENDSLNNDIASSNNESFRDSSLFEDLSILYQNNNFNINEKYPEIIAELNRIADINFNVFILSKASNNMELMVLMNHLLRLYNFKETLDINTTNYKNYFYVINTHYRKNAYHNSIHGCDVTQTFYFMMKTCNVDVICHLTDLDIFSCYFASAIHDLDHPGNNNNYEIAVGSTLALSYNDKAVLENYHLCKAFSLAKKPGCDIFENFNLQTYNLCRALIINMVLSTDMANHFLDLNLIKTRVKAEDFNPSGSDKQLLLNELIHAADISNPLKPWDIYKEWVIRVFKEFFSQGDKERDKGLKISFLCDRHTVNIPEAQIGFIENIVFPLYDSLAIIFPNMKMINNLIVNNKDEFKKLKENQVKIVV